MAKEPWDDPNFPARSNSVVERSCELNRRVGFAVAEITEAMGFLEDCLKSDARYWAMKALIRARDMLTSGSVT
jgi:hypothetical protein